MLTGPAMPGHRSKAQIRLLILSAATVVAISLAWQGHIAYHLLSDEGFLWYGSQRVILGEVPIRDFMAYDPGRYYWSAAVMTLIGDNGVIASRLAAALFQLIGLFFALLAVTPANKPINVIRVLLSSFTLGLWMLPHFKAFDSTVAIWLIVSFAYLCDQPTRGRIYFAGMVVGITAFFGRNHGVYGVFGGLLILSYLRGTQRLPSFLKAFAIWSGGVITGYLPMILMLILVPGFWLQFWESIRFLFTLKQTNLSLPIPWPWLADFQKSWLDGDCNFVVGLFFLAVMIYGLVGIILLARSVVTKQPLSSIYTASAALALPYAHYAFSRADAYHLALGIFPFLLGLLWLTNLNRDRVRTLGFATLFLFTLLSMLPYQPGWRAIRAGNWPAIQVGNTVLIADPATAGAMKSVVILVDKYAVDGQDFLVAPIWPGAYAAFGRKSPTWEIYSLFPQSELFQQAEIERIKKSDPSFVLIFDYALDGLEERRFSRTHRYIYRFIQNNYAPIQVAKPNNPFSIYVSR